MGLGWWEPRWSSGMSFTQEPQRMIRVRHGSTIARYSTTNRDPRRSFPPVPTTTRDWPVCVCVLNRPDWTPQAAWNTTSSGSAGGVVATTSTTTTADRPAHPPPSPSPSSTGTGTGTDQLLDAVNKVIEQQQQQQQQQESLEIAHLLLSQLGELSSLATMQPSTLPPQHPYLYHH